jgi:Tfp pilus assembly protein PilO
MNSREKILAGCLVGIIVIAGGFAVIKTQVYEPGKQLTADIKSDTERQERLRTRLNAADMTVRAWQERTGQTLDRDPVFAAQAFREDVDKLLNRNGLTEGLTIANLKERVEKKGARQGFVELPISVRVKGELENLVDFLRDYYQRPYLVKVDKLTLNAESGGSSTRRRVARVAGDDSGPKLSIAMTLSTLVLPEVNDIEHTTIDLASLDDPEAESILTSAARLKQEDLAEYNEIEQSNIFKMNEPPKQVVRREPVTREEKPTELKPPPPPPPVDSRHDADKYVLNGTVSLEDDPVAYVFRTDRPTQPPEEYRLNDPCDDGKVVLIVPRGMVVRVSPPKTGPRVPPKNYFYPLGHNFRERQEVNPTDHQEVARLLRLVLKPDKPSPSP